MPTRAAGALRRLRFDPSHLHLLWNIEPPRRNLNLICSLSSNGTRFALLPFRTVSQVMTVRLDLVEESDVNFRQIAETAVLVAANSGRVIEQPSIIPSGPLWQFRTFSTLRTQCWLRTLHVGPIADGSHGITERQPSQPDGTDAEAVITEIFVSEMLTRSWVAVLIAADRCRGVDNAGPIARSVLANQLTARNAALRLLAGDRVLTAAQRENANRIRRRSERWSDLLVSHLVCRYGLTGVVHEEQRAQEFGQDRLAQGAIDPHSIIWSLTRAGLRTAFPSGGSLPASQSARFHRGIVRSIVATFAALDVAQRRTLRLQR